MKAKKKLTPQALHRHVCRHIEATWQGRDFEYFRWDLGPIKKVLPHFRVARIRPSKESQSWVYISNGLSTVERDGVGRLEVFVLSPCEDALHVELLAMIAHFCADPKMCFGLHSILEIGRSWIEESSCDHLLISLPYTIGPKLEWLRLSCGQTIRVLWALPITKAEAAFARTEGVEALEQLFDRHRINPIDPNRKSVV